jgi:methylated-DNA-protein-cysteine methyltransferase-like protein
MDPNDIYDLVRQIPSGRVSTFGDLARLAGRPRNARQVGRALRDLPDDHDVPWWRVIRRSGSLPGHGHPERHAEHLRKEGVEVTEGWRVDLNRYRWD